MRGGLLVLIPAIVAGAIGAVVAWGAHGNDPEFIFRQGTRTEVEARSVASVIVLHRDPEPGKGNTRARSATCRPGSPSDLRNPWRCRVTYGSGRKVVYRVEVSRDGNLRGIDRTRTLSVSGCCVDTPRPR
jgi:hypothetical protein